MKIYNTNLKFCHYFPFPLSKIMTELCFRGYETIVDKLDLTGVRVLRLYDCEITQLTISTICNSRIVELYTSETSSLISYYRMLCEIIIKCPNLRVLEYTNRDLCEDHDELLCAINRSNIKKLICERYISKEEYHLLQHNRNITNLEILSKDNIGSIYNHTNELNEIVKQNYNRVALRKQLCITLLGTYYARSYNIYDIRTYKDLLRIIAKYIMFV